MSLILSIWTVIVAILFTGITIWAWSGKNRERFEQAARIPMDDNDEFGDSDSGDADNG